ncbi:MAG: nucleotide sugar dehydrogenase [Candidatus Brocadiaceae bacterium]|jgi:UDP-N-acetyl-D-glucosamine dehydrogenase
MTTLQLIRDKEAAVGVIGMGYVGLPLACAFGDAGFPVLGFDIDPKKVEALNEGRSYIKHIPDTEIEQLRGSGRFEATADFDRLDEPDCILICVPTPLTETRDPDLTYVERTAEDIAARLRAGQLVVLESTTYPGTTREVLQPILEDSGLRVGEDFYLAYSPEREDPGNPEHTMRRIPKVVGGVGERSLQTAAALYRAVAPAVVPVSSTDTAEATKILENIYRAVNIALVNELKMLFDRMGIDVWEVIEAAGTKPFGFHPFYPGPGWGGHCIPIDPFYLSWKGRQFGVRTHFIERAGEVNTFMTEFVANKVAQALNADQKPVRNSKVLLLGVAYKPNVDDIRESPALPLIERLKDAGAQVSYHDPHIPVFPSLRDYPGLKLESVELTPEELQRQDAVVIVTDHDAYDFEWIARHARLIIDTRNAVPALESGARIVKA